MVSTIPMNPLFSTSFDISYPPSNICDGDESTFWISSGLYPQTVAFKFSKPIQITRITLVVGKVNNLIVYSGLDPEFQNWQKIDLFHFDPKPIKQQDQRQLSIQTPSYGIKLEIIDGYGPFCYIYFCIFDGPTFRNPEN